MRSKPRADKCVLQTQFLTLHGAHFRFTIGTWWPERSPSTRFYLEIATASIDGTDWLLDVLYYQDLSTLIQRAEDCYEMESEQPGYLASRPLEIFAMTPTGAPREDRMVF
jgi:hypothetical protein